LTLNNQQPAETEIRLFTDTENYFQVHGTTLAAGGETGAVIVLRDMTRMRRLEDVRRDFVANVSHELKTPVTSIKGFVETLLDGAIQEPEQARRFLEIIAKHTDRLNAIIEDLLSLSRLEEDSDRRRISFQRERLLPILKAAAELAKVKADEKKISITISCDEQQAAKVNSILLEQAVLNLIDNAIKYSEPGDEIKVAAWQQDNTVLISVEDRGSGIATEHLERIFERFYVVDKGRSRKLGGTGLGLAIVKHIAQVHGGSVTVKSALGKGSTFTIHLPAD
jgi:two-component system phosphate regulon sensor histidine kinase PhoR